MTRPELRPTTTRSLVGIVLAALLVLGAAGCGKSRPKENVQPPEPGVPASAADVQGIYRTAHQALLQLRGNGSFVLIVPEGPGPSGGDYTLADGRLTVTTDDCGAVVGEYNVAVEGQPVAGKAKLLFAAVRDECGARQHYLTLEPWVYAVS